MIIVEEELFEASRNANTKLGNKIDNVLLERILALVVKHPLNEDRKVCQDQIFEVIKQSSGGDRS
ncbi:MAG: hypothetical protein ACTSUO_04220 [Candidatus Thorarchaeota archaeon]